jgi:hypothetical protein
MRNDQLILAYERTRIPYTCGATQQR